MKHIIFALIIAIASICHARTINIDANGTGDYPTIQAAINDSNNGDVIVLQPGRYIGSGNVNVDCNGRSITIQSIDPNDSNISANTIIDCQLWGFAIKFTKGESTTLAGLTIMNGSYRPSPKEYISGAVYSKNSNPFIYNCIIKKNTGPMSYISGIDCEDSNITLIGCTLSENYYGISCYDINAGNVKLIGCTLSKNKYGINSYNSNAEINNCIINNNLFAISFSGPQDVFGRPSGILNTTKISDSIISDNNQAINSYSVNLLIERTTITGNIPSQYYYMIAGIYSQYCNLVINDSIISRNISNYSGYTYDAGGIANDNGTLEINRCVISDNKAAMGGGITNYQGSLIIKNSQITNNTAGSWNYDGKGGGIYNYRSNKFIIENCSISNNKIFDRDGQYQWIGYGGGIYDSGGDINNLVITKSYFDKNKALNGGGIFGSYIRMNNCVLTNNEAQNGGAIYSGSPYILNCTFIGNRAINYSGINGSGMISNCIFWDDYYANQPRWNELPNYYAVSFSNTKETNIRGQQGPGNISVDPKFVFDNDGHLSPGSPCIDKGTNNSEFLPEMPDALDNNDIDGNPRIVDGDSSGQATVDMGAYEFNSSISRIAVSETEFFFSCAKGGPVQTQLLQITNCGSGNLDWQIIENCPWLNLSQNSGTSAGNPSNVEISVDSNQFQVGVYQADMLITSSAAGSPKSIHVTLKAGRLLSVPQAYNTIQSAIDDANNGDWVIVADGIYTGDGNRDIDFKGKAITVCSQNGPQNCIIDCNGTADSPHNGFNLLAGENSDLVLDGFTITNGFYQDGGAVRIASTPTIKNCIFRKNQASSGGAIAVLAQMSQIAIMPVTIQNCSFIENTCSAAGGAISCDMTVNIIDCNFIRNSSPSEFPSYSGGAIYFRLTGFNIIKGCNFIENFARRGAGVIIMLNGLGGEIRFINTNITGNTGDDSIIIIDSSISVIFSNTLITGNKANILRGILLLGPSQITDCTIMDNKCLDGSAALYFGRPTIKNSIIANDGPDFNAINPRSIVSFSNIKGGFNGEGNIDVDPCFVKPGYWDTNGTADDMNDDFWVGGDYSLKPKSLCINKGDPNYAAGKDEKDLEGNPRITFGRIDIGAYEFQNKQPVADAGPNQVVYAWIDGIADVTLDGSASYDTDGDQLTYLWRWVVDGNEFEANSVNPTIELPVGQYMIEIIVNDGFEDSEPNYVDINVIGPVKGSLMITPQVINRKCEQRNLMAIIQLPLRITKEQIDNNEPLTLYPGGIEANRQYILPYYAYGIRSQWIVAYFDRDEVLDAITSNGAVQLYVVGQLKTGQYFYGSDTPKIINPGWRPKKWGNMRDWFHYWKWHNSYTWKK